MEMKVLDINKLDVLMWTKPSILADEIGGKE